MDYYSEIRKLMFEWVEKENISADRLAFEVEEILDEVQCEMGDDFVFFHSFLELYYFDRNLG